MVIYTKGIITKTCVTAMDKSSGKMEAFIEDSGKMICNKVKANFSQVNKNWLKACLKKDS